MTATPGAPDWACELCNFDLHRCHFCGDPTTHEERGVHPECVPVEEGT